MTAYFEIGHHRHETMTDVSTTISREKVSVIHRSLNETSRWPNCPAVSENVSVGAGLDRQLCSRNMARSVSLSSDACDAWPSRQHCAHQKWWHHQGKIFKERSDRKSPVHTSALWIPLWDTLDTGQYLLLKAINSHSYMSRWSPRGISRKLSLVRINQRTESARLMRTSKSAHDVPPGDQLRVWDRLYHLWLRCSSAEPARTLTFTCLSQQFECLETSLKDRLKTETFPYWLWCLCKSSVSIYDPRPQNM